jgi:phosphate transport system substrate-binding protein
MQPIMLGEYRLIATLGRGGMADVFLAVRSGVAGFHKLVVVKRLRAELTELPEAPKYRALLLDEARLAARLRHPGIVQTFEVGEFQGQPYLAMEYLDGQPLSAVLTKARRMERRLPAALALQLVADALGALAYAHELADYDGTPLKIVHRDVSPQNVFWTYDGEIKLVDFGVAKFARTSRETDAGVVKGKLTYMAPEQARGHAVDGRADVFVTGIILWELMSGRRLLRAPTPAASMQRLLFEELPALTRVVPGIDPEIARICDRALERDRDRRYQTAAAMRADLDQVLAQRAPRRDDLAAFIQPLFVDERAAMAGHIRDALASDGELISLAVPERLSSSIHAAEVLETAPTGAEPRGEPGRPATLPGPGPSAAHRRGWLVALAVTAVAVLIADVLLWRAPRDAAVASEVRPAPAAAPIVTPAPPAEPHAVAPPALRLCGSNTIGAELAPALVEAFLRRKGATAVARDAEPEHIRLTAQLAGASVVVDVRAAGTATAFDGLAAGTCDLGMASRAINDKELARLAAAGHGDLSSPATEHVIGLDGIAVIVHPNNRIGALERGQLHDVFTGKITNWAQLGGAPGPIRVLARDNQSGTFDTFKNLVLAGDALVASAQRFAESEALADTVAGEPAAIGFIGLAYIRSAKALRVGDPGGSPRLPSSFTVTTEEYMLSRRLYLYSTPRPSTPLVTELVSYVLSPPGQAVVRGASFIDLTVAARDGEPCDLRCPRAYVAIIGRAKRLSLNFRFRSGSEELDSRATRDLDRVVQLLATTPDARLLLLGFSDAAGAYGANVKLSQHRAAAIARELEVRGVRPAVVEGFGSAMPVASNATEADRQRNRRVEVWLETDR